MAPLRLDGLLVALCLVSEIIGSVIPIRSAPALRSTSQLNLNLNFIEAVSGYGYQAEEHAAQTEDGYLLSLFRITKGVKCQGAKRRTPVLLMHGLLLNADCWIDAGPEAGLAYLTADACFDTWVGSVRGTYYSRKHVHLNPDRDKKFWKFSVDEIGLYDVPAMIDYVLNRTGVNQLNYIGYSQGAGTFFVMCSERPGYCDKTKVMIALAPATRHFYTKSLIFRLVPQLIMHHRKIFDAFGVWEIFGRRLPIYEFLSSVCQHESALKFCEFVLALFDAPHPRSISNDTLKVLFKHVLAGTSTQNIARYGQSVLSRQFIKFDHGESKNSRLYGTVDPPAYNLTAVNASVVVIYGNNDGIVDKKDVQWLVSELPNVKESIAVQDKHWTHLDMVFSQYTSIVIFPSILKYLTHYD